MGSIVMPSEVARQGDAAAEACHAMAVRFRRGRRLIVFRAGGPSAGAQHVAVTAYQVLRELVHVFFEQPGVLDPGIVR